MGLGEMQLYSAALHRVVPFSFYLPDPGLAGPGPYPALLQLHGASDNHTSWITHSRFANYLERLPLIAIMPDGALSSWSNWKLRVPPQPYEDFVMQDLLPACRHFFPIQPGRWAIGGLSMGGYGSLRLGLKYPDRFASIYAHSSLFWGHEKFQFDEVAPGMTDAERADADVYTHADRAVSLQTRPTLGFDCGIDDGFIQQNRSFHAHLDTIGYPHEYHDYAGGHTWVYWDDHVQTALKQHLDVFGAAAP